MMSISKMLPTEARGPRRRRIPAGSGHIRPYTPVSSARLITHWFRSRAFKGIRTIGPRRVTGRHRQTRSDNLARLSSVVGWTGGVSLSPAPAPWLKLAADDTRETAPLKPGAQVV